MITGAMRQEKFDRLSWRVNSSPSTSPPVCSTKISRGSRFWAICRATTVFGPFHTWPGQMLCNRSASSRAEAGAGSTTSTRSMVGAMAAMVFGFSSSTPSVPLRAWVAAPASPHMVKERLFGDQSANGSVISTRSSRSGLVVIIATGAPISSSMRRTYLIAAAGSSRVERAPRVLSLQPSSSS